MSQPEDEAEGGRPEPSSGRGGEEPWGVPPTRYRLPPETRLGCVRLQVADLSRSEAWYREILGFRTTSLGEGRMGLAPQDGSDLLVELHEREGCEPMPDGGRLGLYHFAILLPDRPALGRFAAHLRTIRARGVLPRVVGAADHQVSEALYLKDPDGLGVEVYADRPPSSWEHEGRQLVMTTDPLDLDGVIEAGGGRSWEGMPQGTVIGHIHLHVGDLGEAEAFYHEGIGLDKVVWSYPGALFLSAGGYHHHLGLNTWARGSHPADPDGARLLEWELVVPTRDAVRELARNLGVDAGPRGGDGLQLSDPWGTAVRILSSEGR